MGWHSTCSVCGEISRYACSDTDSKSAESREVLRCPNASREAKRYAAKKLGVPSDILRD